MRTTRVKAAHRPARRCSDAMVDDLFPLMDSSSAVEPTIRIDQNFLNLAYYLPDCYDSAVVRFAGVASWYYGSPSDERLNSHVLWGKGLTFYNFHISNQGSAPKIWVATFHDGTFEISALEAAVVSPRVTNASPSEALDTVLGQVPNQALDGSAA